MAWLIDSLKQRVYIYRPGRDTRLREDQMRLVGDPELPHFILNVRELW